MEAQSLTFEDHKSRFPISERTLREIVAKLGFRCGRGFCRLVSAYEQFDNRIGDEVVCVTVAARQFDR